MRHGKRAVRLDCWGENPRLVSYYQRLGYRPCGVVDVNGWQAQLLEKAVQPS
jgi:RimJ/RimL family protein N-acetyltransferase